MSHLSDIHEDLTLVANGIKKLGRNRVVALSAHQQWELTDELEQRLATTLAKLERIQRQQDSQTATQA